MMLPLGVDGVEARDSVEEHPERQSISGSEARGSPRFSGVCGAGPARVGSNPTPQARTLGGHDKRRATG
jgi:hypothetical protein